MDLVIKLSARLTNKNYKATEKGSRKVLFYGKTKKECIARSREYARTSKKGNLILIDDEGRIIYKKNFERKPKNAYYSNK